MRWILLIIYIFSSLQPLIAQQKDIEIVGEIVDSDTREPVPYVHIVNISTQQGTVSNTQGRFWINIGKEDTLLISTIGFEPYSFILKDDVNTNKLIVTIALNSATMELKPVEVFAFRNEETLKQALKETEVPLGEPDRGIELPGFYYGPKKRPKDIQFDNSQITLTGPFSLLSRKFSKEAKEKKRLKTYESQYQSGKLIKAKFNEDVVIDLTGLPKDKVEEFIEFCSLSDSYLVNASEYEIAVAVNKCLVDFNDVVRQDSMKKVDN